ncbi:MAG: A32-like packaging ATPase, partial [Satyrvirus sp.]
PNPSIVMIARRGSGKSYIARDIIYHYRHLPAGIVIAPTDRMTGFYKKFFPDLFIHYDFKNNILEKILVRQRLMTMKQINKRKQGKKVDPCGILIMDDCLATKRTWAKDDNITEILMNGRHYNLTYILTMQAPLGIAPDLRFNFDYVFLLKEDSVITKKKLYDNYASMFSNLAMFEIVHSKCTENFCCMVIDNRKPSDKISEKVFWFRAKERNFKFGSREFRKFHKKYCNPFHADMKIPPMTNLNTLFRNTRKGDVDIKVEKMKSHRKKEITI